VLTNAPNHSSEKRKDPGVPKFAAVAAKKEAAKVEQKTKEKERWREKARLQNVRLLFFCYV
jgi:hypothetical protein